MAPKLDAAIADLFTQPRPKTAPPEAPAATTAVATNETALAQARLSLDRARKALQQGDWEAFGKAMDSLEHQLTGKPN